MFRRDSELRRRLRALFRRLNVFDSTRPETLDGGPRAGDDGAFSGRFDGHA